MSDRARLSGGANQPRRSASPSPDGEAVDHGEPEAHGGSPHKSGARSAWNRFPAVVARTTPTRIT